MVAFTKRLSLFVPAMSDELTAQRDNWDRLDTSFTGVIWVAPDTVPDTSILFEGCLVAERGTGKVWRAQKNSSGIFEKKWIVFPWIYTGDTSFTVAVDFSGSPIGEYGVVTTTPGLCINSGPSDVQAGRIVLPVTGIYQVVITHRFEPSAINDLRYVQMMFNGVVSGETLNYDSFKTANSFNGYQSIHCMRLNRRWAAGTQICLAVRHSAGGNIPCNTHFAVACVRPT